MPALGNALDFSKFEGKNFRAHNLTSAPSSPVTGQLYYNSSDNTLYWYNGSTWISAAGTTPPDATAAVKGVIQLTGDLAGTAASPQIAAGVIVNADVSAGAAIAYSKLALTNSIVNGDLVGGIALSKLATDPLARANHTGTQLAATISDFMATVLTQRLDQHVAPTAAVTFNNQKATNLADPTADQDGANKRYVDNLVAGVDAKASVRAASTANLTLSGTQTVDGVALIAGDRVLVKDQSGAASNPVNGIYTVAAGAWSRAADMDSGEEFASAFVFVEQGTANADSGWLCTNELVNIGTTPVAWVQFSGAGQITSGAGLTKTGNQLDVGAGAGITVNADNVQVANNGITNAMLADGAVNLASADVTGTLPVSAGGTGQVNAGAARTSLGAMGRYWTSTHGAGTTISITQATHLLGVAPIVQVQDAATGAVEFPDIVINSSGDVTVTYGASVAANSKKIVIIG